MFSSGLGFIQLDLASLAPCPNHGDEESAPDRLLGVVGHTTISAGEILTRIRNGQAEQLASVAGVFSAVSIINGRVRVFVHPFGIYPVFIANTAKELLIGDPAQWWNIIDALRKTGASPSLSPAKVAAKVAFGVNSALVDEISQVPSGGIYDVHPADGGAPSLEPIQVIENFFDESVVDRKEALERIHIAVGNTTAYIANMANALPGSTVAASISGGLDSRYCLAIGSNLIETTFQLAHRGHQPLMLDTMVARKLVEASDIGRGLATIDPTREHLATKAALDIETNPVGSANFLKATYLKQTALMPQDLLITGSHGGAIGGRVMTTDLLRKVASGRHTAILRAYARHSFRGNTTLGLTNSFIAPTAFSQAVQSQEASLAAITASTALQLTRSFHNARHQATGAFESLHGQLRSISIYEPYLMREFARFSRHLLLNRSIARQYLYVYHRYLARANMPLQDLSHVWPIQRQSRLRKLVRKIALKSVGHSLNYSQWAKALRFPQWAKDELRTSPICSQSIFDCREIFQMLNRKPYIHHQVVEDAIKFAIISKRLREF